MVLSAYVTHVQGAMRHVNGRSGALRPPERRRLKHIDLAAAQYPQDVRQGHLYDGIKTLAVFVVIAVHYLFGIV